MGTYIRTVMAIVFIILITLITVLGMSYYVSYCTLFSKNLRVPEVWEKSSSIEAEATPTIDNQQNNDNPGTIDECFTVEYH